MRRGRHRSCGSATTTPRPLRRRRRPGRRPRRPAGHPGVRRRPRAPDRDRAERARRRPQRGAVDDRRARRGGRGTPRPARAALVLGLGWDESRWPEAAAVHRAPSSTGPPGERPVYLSPGRRALRGGLHRAARRVPRADRARRVRRDGLVARRRAPRGPRGGVPADRRAPTPGGASPARSATRRGQGIGMVHELGAPGHSPAEDFADRRGLRRRQPLPEVVGYWGELDGRRATPSSSAAPARPGTSTSTARSARAPRPLHAAYADADTSGHLYLDRRPGPRPRGGLHHRPTSRPASTCIGDRAVAEVVERARAGRRDRRRPGGRPGPAPPRARRDGHARGDDAARRARRHRQHAADVRRGSGAGTTRCTPSGSAPTGPAG